MGWSSHRIFSDSSYSDHLIRRFGCNRRQNELPPGTAWVICAVEPAFWHCCASFVSPLLPEHTSLVIITPKELSAGLCKWRGTSSCCPLSTTPPQHLVR